MIEFEQATRVFRNKIAFEDVTFSARSGQVTVLLGPNGAGKSTLFRCLLELDRLDSGTAHILGGRFRSLSNPGKKVGVLLDTTPTDAGMTAFDYLFVKALAVGVSRSRVHEVLALFDLADVAKKRISKFSLGMKQRLSLAYALLSDPQILILDEPLNGLDALGIIRLRELIARLTAEGKTVLIASHFMNELEALADHVVVMNHGKVVADSSLKELVKRSALEIRVVDNRAWQQTLVSECITFEQSEDVFVCRDIDAKRLGALALSAGIVVLEMRAQIESLESAFLRLTGYPTLDS